MEGRIFFYIFLDIQEANILFPNFIFGQEFYPFPNSGQYNTKHTNGFFLLQIKIYANFRIPTSFHS